MMNNPRLSGLTQIVASVLNCFHVEWQFNVLYSVPWKTDILFSGINFPCGLLVTEISFLSLTTAVVFLFYNNSVSV